MEFCDIIFFFSDDGDCFLLAKCYVYVSLFGVSSINDLLYSLSTTMRSPLNCGSMFFALIYIPLIFICLSTPISSTLCYIPVSMFCRITLVLSISCVFLPRNYWISFLDSKYVRFTVYLFTRLLIESGSSSVYNLSPYLACTFIPNSSTVVTYSCFLPTEEFC